MNHPSKIPAQALCRDQVVEPCFRHPLQSEGFAEIVPEQQKD